MSLKRNIIANYASQIYVTLTGICMVPLYISYMGAEAYGLVGFFAMLQAWFALLDMGLTPTIARETARFNGGAMDAMSYRRLFRALEGVFFLMAVVGGVALFLFSGSIAHDWLKAEALSVIEIQLCLQMMSFIIAMRWMAGLYRGAISGAERLVWLGNFNALVASMRFVLVLPLLIFVSAAPTTFFGFQLAIALIELVGLLIFAYHLLPKLPNGQRIQWEWAPLKPLLKFSLTIAFTSSVWVLVTQTDKLVLSKILPLADYGYFTVTVLVAAGIMIVSGPISGAIMPRMTRLEAEGKHAEIIVVYRQATQLVTVLAMPVALVLALFSKHVLWAWTGDAELVEKAAPVLTLYACGYGILAISAFPYYLQYAKGNLKLHLIGNLFFVGLLIPSIVWATLNFGMIGAGWAWLIANLIYFLLWVPLVHHHFALGLHWPWLTRDVFFTGMPAILFAFLVQYVASWPVGRIAIAIQLCVLGILLLIITSLSSREVRAKLSNSFYKRILG
jgi:O-antigen/teichoic acid export membrane protein